MAMNGTVQCVPESHGERTVHEAKNRKKDMTRAIRACVNQCENVSFNLEQNRFETFEKFLL